jgi:ATP-dependent DNA helicase PIF1
MANVKLLIIDEYSFLSADTIDKLDNRLRAIFPHSALPFGGIDIILCGDPAQLPPVLAKPLYAHQAATAHVAARFHQFRTVVELDQPFRQTGDDGTQSRFRSLLSRLSLCQASDGDWTWLMSRRPACLSPEENSLFDSSKYVVSKNHLRKRLNYDRIASFTPVLKIDEGDVDIQPADADDYNDAEGADHDDSKLFAVGAEVMLTYNLWTEAALVNAACGTVVEILKPLDDRLARVVMVNFPTYRGPALSLAHPTVVLITQIRTPNCKGMPLTLAWAITIHKSQGMTLDRLTVDLGDSEFTSGLTFCYRRHLHQSRGRLGAWVSRGNRPQKETLGSVSMYPLVLLTSLVAVTVCRPLPPSPLFDDVPMTSTYVRVFWTLVSPPDDAL